MHLKIRAKQLGRKRALIEDKIIEIDNIGNTPTFRDLLSAVVKQQVDEYNAKPVEKSLLPFLSKDDIQAQSETGKIGFGSIYNENKADMQKAQETALQAFEDGMFAVFIGEVQLSELSQRLLLADDSVVTFVRLTFLAGSYW